MCAGGRTNDGQSEGCVGIGVTTALAHTPARRTSAAKPTVPPARPSFVRTLSSGSLAARRRACSAGSEPHTIASCVAVPPVMCTQSVRGEYSRRWVAARSAGERWEGGWVAARQESRIMRGCAASRVPTVGEGVQQAQGGLHPPSATRGAAGHSTSALTDGWAAACCRARCRATGCRAGRAAGMLKDDPAARQPRLPGTVELA